jgi:hypothetical protein
MKKNKLMSHMFYGSVSCLPVLAGTHKRKVFVVPFLWRFAVVCLLVIPAI